ncbi:hypothetical protein DMUE_4632 [Dictyocoela muelleri]|nr:hypothetical protein DMUE_4632 [Dictyocoela muelleri]
MLAYVPIKNVISEFYKLNEIKKDIKEYNDAFEYFRDHFIIKNKNIKTMEISFWSISDRILNLIPTTTNSCEAYHRYMNSKISRKNPDLGKIIDILKKEEKRCKIIINNLKNGILLQPFNNYKNIRIIIQNYDFYEKFEFYETLDEIINIYI